MSPCVWANLFARVSHRVGPAYHRPRQHDQHVVVLSPAGLSNGPRVAVITGFLRSPGPHLPESVRYVRSGCTQTD